MMENQESLNEYTRAPFKCVGLLGKIFGHKFKTSNMEWVRWHDFCQRCGMPLGGWVYEKLD